MANRLLALLLLFSVFSYIGASCYPRKACLAIIQRTDLCNYSA